jgi:hypothetical protein
LGTNNGTRAASGENAILYIQFSIPWLSVTWNIMNSKVLGQHKREMQLHQQTVNAIVFRNSAKEKQENKIVKYNRKKEEFYQI